MKRTHAGIGVARSRARARAALRSYREASPLPECVSGLLPPGLLHSNLEGWHDTRGHCTRGIPLLLVPALGMAPASAGTERWRRRSIPGCGFYPEYVLHITGRHARRLPCPSSHATPRHATPRQAPVPRVSSRGFLPPVPRGRRTDRQRARTPPVCASSPVSLSFSLISSRPEHSSVFRVSSCLLRN